MKPSDIPIRSTWRDAIGPKMTDRRIINRVKEGWYGELAKLRQLARSANKQVRANAKKKLERFEGVTQRAKRTRPISQSDLSEFV